MVVVLFATLFVACGGDKKPKAKKAPAASAQPAKVPPAQQPYQQAPNTTNYERFSMPQTHSGTSTGHPGGKVGGDYPVAGPSDGSCGVDRFCDLGEGRFSALPTSITSDLAGFDARDIRRCMAAATSRGIPTYGSWEITGQRVVSAVGQQLNWNSAIDFSYTPTVILLNVKTYLSPGQIELNHPNAIYCLKSQSYLSTFKYTSCYPNNVFLLEEDKWIAANTYVVPAACGFNQNGMPYGSPQF